jgi:cold shock CspA family protein
MRKQATAVSRTSSPGTIAASSKQRTGGKSIHRNAVVDAAFDRLKVGSEVAFAEEEGVKGPQASTVRVVGGHRRAYPIDAANYFSGEEASRSRSAEVFSPHAPGGASAASFRVEIEEAGFATRAPMAAFGSRFDPFATLSRE